jgi:hypothetical protein
VTPRVVVKPAPVKHAPVEPASRSRHPGRRWRLVGVFLSLLLIAAAVAGVELSRHDHTATGAVGSSAAGSRAIAAEAAARTAAVSWITSQVAHYTIVACDAVMCSDLAQHGIPASDMQVLQPTSPDPYGGVLIIATADIRSQFGSKLARVYAPQVIASFGTGTNRIDVRVVAPLGPVAFRSALGADLAARRSSGALLLRNPRVRTSLSARALLAAGQVDQRLLTTIASLASQQPVEIAGFSTSAPGASRGIPLRFVYLATSDPASRLSGPAYVRTLTAQVQSQGQPYIPLSIATIRLPDGQPVLRIEFGAPSPTGLLKA